MSYADCDGLAAKRLRRTALTRPSLTSTKLRSLFLPPHHLTPPIYVYQRLLVSVISFPRLPHLLEHPNHSPTSSLHSMLYRRLYPSFTATPADAKAMAHTYQRRSAPNRRTHSVLCASSSTRGHTQAFPPPLLRKFCGEIERAARG